ncbi:gp53-like domain-containing protein [Megasphaera jansseni]
MHTGLEQMTHTLPHHGFMRFLSASKQWGNITIKSGSNFGYFTYPLIYPAQAQSVVLTHMNNNHTVFHSAVYLDSRSRCALYGETTFTADTEFYIIAIGY